MLISTREGLLIACIFGRGTGKTGSGVGDSVNVLVIEAISGIVVTGAGSGIMRGEQAKPANIINIIIDSNFIVIEFIRI
jgi:hypothetical protein